MPAQLWVSDGCPEPPHGVQLPYCTKHMVDLAGKALDVCLLGPLLPGTLQMGGDVDIKNAVRCLSSSLIYYSKSCRPCYCMALPCHRLPSPGISACLTHMSALPARVLDAYNHGLHHTLIMPGLLV